MEPFRYHHLSVFGPVGIRAGRCMSRQADYGSLITRKPSLLRATAPASVRRDGRGGVFLPRLVSWGGLLPGKGSGD